MQTLMRLVSLTVFFQLSSASLASKPKADWKTLTQGLKSPDLATQVATLKSKPKAAPAPLDKAAAKQNVDDELQRQMAERELKMQAHHDNAPMKKQVQAVMSADKQLKQKMEQKLHEKEILDKARHEKAMKEKLAKVADTYKPKQRKAAPAKPVEEEAEEPLEEIPKAPPRKKLRAPVVVSEPEEPEVEREVAIPRAQPAPRKAPPAPQPQPVAHVNVGAVPQSEEELPMPSWGPKDSDNGASARKVGGNPWADVGGRRQHKQTDADEIQKQVEAAAAEELKVGHLPKLPVAVPKKTHRQVVQESEALAEHFEDGNGIAHFSANKGLHKARDRSIHGAPAPGPGPAPGPAPWSEDPEWMVDGARGDKSRTKPIGQEFKGLASIPQPEQGFHGRPIVHEDMETMTGDWGSEFGPKGPSSAYKVCKEHPRSYWCRTHMKELSAGEDFGGLAASKAPASDDDEEEEDDPQKPPWKKSGASSMSAFAGLMTVAMVFLAM